VKQALQEFHREVPFRQVAHLREEFVIEQADIRLLEGAAPGRDVLLGEEDANALEETPPPRAAPSFRRACSTR